MSANHSTRKNLPSPEVRTFLSAYSPEVQALALKLRALVLKVAPRALEQIDLPAKLLGYGFAQTYRDTLCVILPTKSGVSLGFPRGVDLPDPSGLLVGTGKRARHVKLLDLDEISNPALRALLIAALAQLRSGV